MIHFVADLGNSRLKWARVDETGQLGGKGRSTSRTRSLGRGVVAVGDSRPANHRRGRSRRSTLRSRRSSPSFSKSRQIGGMTWFQAAAEVPVPKDVEGAETGGADRALGVLAPRSGSCRRAGRDWSFRAEPPSPWNASPARASGRGVRSRPGSAYHGQRLASPHGSGPLDRHASIRPATTRRRPGAGAQSPR